MPVDVTTEVVIRRPREVVAAYATDPANAPRWYARIHEVEPAGAGQPLAVGDRIGFVATFLGRRLAYTYEVMALEPGRRLVMRTANGPFPMETTYSWSDAGAGATRMALRNRGNPSGFPRLIAPLLGTAVKRANQGDLARLRELLES